MGDFTHISPYNAFVTSLSHFCGILGLILVILSIFGYFGSKNVICPSLNGLGYLWGPEHLGTLSHNPDFCVNVVCERSLILMIVTIVLIVV